MTKSKNHKATIETMINTAALALTSYGVLEITKQNYYGFICVMFGMGLEFLKYWGRHHNYW
jgi:hypothetical protein